MRNYKRLRNPPVVRPVTVAGQNFNENHLLPNRYNIITEVTECTIFFILRRKMAMDI